MIVRSQKLLLHPTASQERLFNGSCGLSRFAWNWALALCKRHYAIFGRKPGYKQLSAFTLRKHWNKVKDRRFPWVRNYSKLIPEDAFRKLDQAFTAAYKRIKLGKPAGLPVFHKKWHNHSFQVVPSNCYPLTQYGRRVRIPVIGLVKVQTRMRWKAGVQVSGRVRLKAGRWWLMLSYEFPDPKPEPHTGAVCGIDLGCTKFATIASGGEVVDEVKPPKPYAKAKRKLKRLQRWMNRRAKGGKNRQKVKLSIARQHERVANVRANFLHQFTSRLVKRYGVVVLEDLTVKGIAVGRLASTVHDLGLGIFRQQVEYKAEVTGTRVVLADRWYPSSKTCSFCGLVKTKLGLKERVWKCVGCGVVHNRDHNAALNLEKLGRGTPEVTPVETGVSGERKRPGAGRGNRNIRTKSRKGASG